jgi:uncharacterized membrane protein
MVKALVAASIVWPLLLAGTVAARVNHTGGVGAAVVYAIGSRICHQRPERSFHTDGVKWPVCGRCAGLYFGAPAGAIAAVIALRRRLRERTRWWLAIAAVPTALTLAIEWSGAAPVTNAMRAASALPLGATIAWVLVRAAAGRFESMEYTDVA